MNTVTLARHAMATRFEIVLHGDNPVSLRAAGEEALDEVDRLEAQLSLFRPSSEIARVNALAAREPVKVTPPLFGLLEHARKLSEESTGAFDITIAPLMQCWGFRGQAGQRPSPDDLAAARADVGMRLVQLDPSDFTVRFSRPGVMIDLGAIGKGYAIERAAELLREAGMTSAVLHGGTSTVYALGAAPGGDCWRISLEDPRRRPDQSVLSTQQSPNNPASFAVVPLKDEALSVSAVWGRFFRAEGRTFGHIIDPRTGHPATGGILSAVVLPSATETDALSTALLTLGANGHPKISALRPGMRTLVVEEADGKLEVHSQGIVANPLN